jgi:hypothetical protein
MRGIGLGVAGFAEGWYPADPRSNPSTHDKMTAQLFGWGCGPAKGGPFQIFTYGSVGGQPPAAAPWHLVLGFLYVSDFMGDLLSHSSSALPPCT